MKAKRKRSGPKPKPVIKRVAAKTARKGKCLVFTGSLNQNGYGQIGTRINGRLVTQSVHRVVWEHHHGAIPVGMQIDHLCRNRACCKVEHLEVVTPRENILRGVGPAAKNARKKRAPCGRKYDRVNNRGQRVCSHCASVAFKRWYESKVY